MWIASGDSTKCCRPAPRTRPLAPDLGSLGEYRSLERSTSRKPTSPRTPGTPTRRLVSSPLASYTTQIVAFLAAIIENLEPLATTDTLRQALLQLSDQAFHTPDWEPWRKHAGFAKTAILPDQQLLGEQRQMLLWVNGLLPFFLAYARQHGEP